MEEVAVRRQVQLDPCNRVSWDWIPLLRSVVVEVIHFLCLGKLGEIRCREVTKKEESRETKQTMLRLENNDTDIYSEKQLEISI